MIARRRSYSVFLLLIFAGICHTQDSWQVKTETGLQALQSGQFEKAERHLREALKQAEKFPVDDERRVTSTQNLIRLYSAWNKPFETGEQYERIVKFREGALGPDHLEVARALEALAGFNLAWSRRFVYGTSYSLSPVTSPYGQIQTSPVAPAVERRVTTPQTAAPPGGRSIAKLSDALGPANRALAIRERLSGADHKDLLPAVFLLAQIHLEMRHWADARAHYSRISRIQESNPDVDPLETPRVLNRAGIFCQSSEAYPEALHYYAQSLGLYKQHFGPEHPDVATVLFNIGVVYLKQEQYDLATAEFERSIAMYEKTLGPTTLKLINPLLRCAEALRNLKRAAEAKALEERANRIRGSA